MMNNDKHIANKTAIKDGLLIDGTGAPAIKDGLLLIEDGIIQYAGEAKEIHDFVDKAGLSEMDTLVAATSNGAKVLGVGDITGSLQAGKAADILVVAGNPLENIHELTVDTITMVMKDGSIIR